MAGIVPNTGASYARQSVLDTVDLETIQMGSNLTGVVSGCATTTAGGVMTVAVAAGVVRIAGKPVTVAGATSDAMTAHASLPKWYLVTINSSGSVVVTAGTQAADPKLPAIPATSVVVAAVYLPAAVVAITAGMIVDKRVTVADTRMGITVAANDAPGWMKSAAHFVCDGVADDVQIQAAIDLAQTYVVTSTHGAPAVLLTPGAFRTSTTVYAKSAPIIGMSVNNAGTRWLWDGADNGICLDKNTNTPGWMSFWKLENINFRAGTGTPNTWLDISDHYVDQQFILAYVHFGVCLGAAITMEGYVNVNWHHLRFDGWGTYAITLTIGETQNLSSFVIDSFTADNNYGVEPSTAKGLILIDNTANASNIGNFWLRHGRYEINRTMSDPHAVFHIIAPAVSPNPRFVNIGLQGFTYQNVIGESTAVLVDCETGGSNAFVGLTLIDVRQQGLTAIFSGETASTLPVQGNYGFVALGSSATDAIFQKVGLTSEATITSGSGAPSASEPNGSIYLRTDGAAGTTIYVRASGAWSANA